MEGRIEDKREREEGEGLILSRTVFITKCPRISYNLMSKLYFQYLHPHVILGGKKKLFGIISFISHNLLWGFGSEYIITASTCQTAHISSPDRDFPYTYHT